MAGTAAWGLARQLSDIYQPRQARVVPEVFAGEEEHISPTAEQPQHLQHPFREKTSLAFFPVTAARKPAHRNTVVSDHSVPQISEGAEGDEACNTGGVSPRKQLILGLGLGPQETLLAARDEAEPDAAAFPDPLRLRGQDFAARSDSSALAMLRGFDAECSGESREGSVEGQEGEHAQGQGPGHAHGAHVELETLFTLSCVRGHSQGVSDIIGTLDWSGCGAHFATGGIARKIRVFSLSSLEQRKGELQASLEEKRSWSTGEEGGEGQERRLEDEDEEDEEISSQEAGTGPGSHRGRGCRTKRRHMSPEFSSSGAGPSAVPFFQRCSLGGLRRKQKASSTSNLEELAERDCLRRDRAGVMDSDASAAKILCTAAKISSLQWSPWAGGVVGCGDYDGVFCEWDVETGMCLTERDEHQGQKIWSIRYCADTATSLAASASEDGTVKLWTSGSEDCVGTIDPGTGSALCSVDFSSDGRFLATGGADAQVYMYDLRQCKDPLAVLRGHDRTVSYTRFMGGLTLASSSIDSTVKVWDLGSLDTTASQGKLTVLRPAATGADHLNRRNFTGLAARRDGMLLAGSEANELVGYRYRAGRLDNCLCFSFGSGQAGGPPSDGISPSMSRKPFVSAMSWQNAASSCLAAANSEGTVRVMKMK